jgi:hypothetical protein
VSDEASARAKRRRARSKQRRQRRKGEADEASTDDDSAQRARPADDPPPKRKKKRKRRKKADDRPPFARSYPRDATLDALVKAFEEGNFAAVREGAPALIEGADVDEDVKRAAGDLRRRINPAPTSVYLWALGVCLLAFLYAYYLSHGH